MGTIHKSRKVLNPRLKILFYFVIFVGVIVIILLITHNNLVTGAISGAIAGGLAVVISFGIVAIVAQMKGIDMYVPKPGAGGTVHESHLHIEGKNPAKKKKGAFWIILIVIVILTIVILTGVLFAKFYNYILTSSPQSATVGDIARIKEAVAEIDVAKQEGDNLGKAPTSKSLQQAEDNAVFGQQVIAGNFSADILPFALAVHNWGAQVQNNASKNNWSKVADGPDSSTIKLSPKDASDTYDSVLNNIGNYQIFGDYAISQNNKDAMKWIAARLHSEEIFLDELLSANIAKGPQNMALAASFGDICYYGRGHIAVISNRAKRADCIKKLNEGIKPLRTAAQNYYKTGDAAAAKDWQVAWGKLKDIGYPISTTGATVGSDNFALPPAMKAFQDACKARGGTSPSGGVKDRLPTTESGQTCTFKGPKGGTCWFLLTDSGMPFAGGDGDCPQINLLPAAIKQINVPETAPAASVKTKVPKKVESVQTAEPAPEQTENAYPYDGSYHATPSVQCSTPDSSTSLNSDIQNFMISFTVKQGKIYYSDWYTNVPNPPSNPTIGSDGNVSSSYTDADSGATEHTEYSAHFSSSGEVSGTLSGYWMFGSGPQTTCSGSFSGSRTGQ